MRASAPTASGSEGCDAASLYDRTRTSRVEAGNDSKTRCGRGGREVCAIEKTMTQTFIPDCRLRIADFNPKSVFDPKSYHSQSTTVQQSAICNLKSAISVRESQPEHDGALRVSGVGQSAAARDLRDLSEGARRHVGLRVREDRLVENVAGRDPRLEALLSPHRERPLDAQIEVPAAGT